MRKITLFFIFLYAVLSVNGQIDFGISGGVNFSSVPEKTLNIGEFEFSTYDDPRTGYHIGLMSQISFLGIFIQPELLYTSISNDMKVYNISTEESDFYIRTINRIDIPVMGGWKLGLIRLGLGPVGSIIVSETSELKNIIQDNTNDEISEEMKNFSWGLQIGGGITLSNLVIDVKYEYGLSKIGDGVTIGGEKHVFDSRPKQFIISLGLLL